MRIEQKSSMNAPGLLHHLLLHVVLGSPGFRVEAIHVSLCGVGISLRRREAGTEKRISHGTNAHEMQTAKTKRCGKHRTSAETIGDERQRTFFASVIAFSISRLRQSPGWLRF
jgi:hypothetical protein